MKTVETTRIPFPTEILKGDWGGIVYAIVTEGMDKAEHEAAVRSEMDRLEDEFDAKNHESVSLRLVKKDIVYEDDRLAYVVSLVQFRVRDSY